MNLLSRHPPHPGHQDGRLRLSHSHTLVEHSPQLLRQLWRSPLQEQGAQDETFGHFGDLTSQHGVAAAQRAAEEVPGLLQGEPSG